jgi:hypothetical protein
MPLPLPWLLCPCCLPLLLLPVSAFLHCFPSPAFLHCCNQLLPSAPIALSCFPTLLVFPYIAAFNCLPVHLLPVSASLHCLSSPTLLHSTASLCTYCLSLPPYIACLPLHCCIQLPPCAPIACLCFPTLHVFPCLPTLLHSTASLCSYCQSMPPYTLLIFTYIATFNYLPLLLLPFPASLHCLSSPAFLSLCISFYPAQLL